MTREEYNENPHLCQYCNLPILCEKGQVLSAIKQKKFCNHSCAATYNNTHKEGKKYYCQKCQQLIGVGYKEYSRRKYCDKCGSSTIDWDTVTYGETKDKRLYQKHSRIRVLAQKVYQQKTNGNQKCEHCGYDKHIEVCHIKPINSFADDSKITEINAYDNLIGLCPNCHWEFDNLSR